LAASVVYTQEVNFAVGTWLSLVEHSLGVRGVGSSNLPVPTKPYNLSQFELACSFLFPALAPDPAGLPQHQREGKSCISATVTVAAAHWILQQQQPFKIL
jgi:hypothetical protein